MASCSNCGMHMGAGMCVATWCGGAWRASWQRRWPSRGRSGSTWTVSGERCACSWLWAVTQRCMLAATGALIHPESMVPLQPACHCGHDTANEGAGGGHAALHAAGSGRTAHPGWGAAVVLGARRWRADEAAEACMLAGQPSCLTQHNPAHLVPAALLQPQAAWRGHVARLQYAQMQREQQERLRLQREREEAALAVLAPWAGVFRDRSWFLRARCELNLCWAWSSSGLLLGLLLALACLSYCTGASSACCVLFGAGKRCGCCSAGGAESMCSAQRRPPSCRPPRAACWRCGSCRGARRRPPASRWEPSSLRHCD